MSEAGDQDAGIRPRLGVSSCLLGQPVRFNGGHSRSAFLTDELGPHVDWVPYCPEIEIGLGSPRETLSCGLRAIPRYPAPGRQPADHRGQGLFARRVTGRYPLLPAEDEGRLNDAVLREEFTERVFAFARLRALFAPAWQPRDLVAFHARHKLQLLAHDPSRYRAAGRAVAAAGSAPRAVTEAAYRDWFTAAMLSRATRGRHANTLQHAFSRVGRELDRGRRTDLAARIEDFRRGADPLSVPVTLLAHYASDGSVPWLAGQTYLRPYPDALRLRHAVPR
jgi:uncharacterized protein YbgA (DUF1722 family)